MSPESSAWFYAALAQTSAAVVGLFGAVLGSHILQHLAAMREERRDVLERINAFHAHLNARIQHWHAFKKYLERKIARENSILEIGSAFFEPVEEVTWEGTLKSAVEFHPGEDRVDSEEDLDLLTRIMPAYTHLEGPVRRSQISDYAERLRECAETLPAHTKPTHLVVHDAVLLEKLFHRVSRFRAHLFPRSFIVVLAALAWLSITGIVWPLSELPGFSAQSSQTFMLIALAAGLLALLGYFAYQFRIFTRMARMTWEKPHLH